MPTGGCSKLMVFWLVVPAMFMDTVIKKLQQIPGVGKSIAVDLYSIGIHSLIELENKDPEELYSRLCAKKGTRIDRCMLYVFRCAVYYASHKKHNPKLLKWWNWKDKKTGWLG
jgi:hypothetical protein